jgi:hypothetical protein
MKSTALSVKQWDLLKTRLANDYSPSVMMMREKRRVVLGFTERKHTEFLGYWDNATKEERKAGLHGYKDTIYLDWFDESKRTMFVLKYSEYLNAGRD